MAFQEMWYSVTPEPIAKEQARKVGMSLGDLKEHVQNLKPYRHDVFPELKSSPVGSLSS